MNNAPPTIQTHGWLKKLFTLPALGPSGFVLMSISTFLSCANAAIDNKNETINSVNLFVEFFKICIV